MSELDPPAVEAFLEGFQDRVCAALEHFEPSARFLREELPGERGGRSRPRVLEGGEVFEKAAVMFSSSRGQKLPAAATHRRPELAGKTYQALSVSLITHPTNPFVPISHANVRFFVAGAGQGEALEEAAHWFGGGFDLTPAYGFEEDARAWHATAKAACDTLRPDLYAELKTRCDEYFYLPHRKEPRGIGGLFFDDWTEGGFEGGFGLMRAVAEGYIAGYMPLVERRKDTPFGPPERDWQLHRRGRYAEFNLAWDRGTRFGLQAGSRAESLLASLPPIVHWSYNRQPAPGSAEAELLTKYLVPRDWLAE